MQVNGRTTIWGQTDFAVDGKKNSVKGKEKELSSVVWQGQPDDAADADRESYVPSDEGMLELYLKQLEQMQEGNENAQSAQDDEIKALRIAHNIMRGMKVPAKDESFLLTKNFKLYMAAKNIASMKECKGTAKSVLDGSESTSSADSAGSVAGSSASGSVSASGIFGEGAFAGTASAGGTAVNEAGAESVSGAEFASVTNAASGGIFTSDTRSNAGANGNFSWNAAGTKNTSGIYTSSTTKYKKKRKKFHYNFKDVSAQIVNAKTSGNARQVLARAKQKTATLRRKLRIGEYDDELVMMAITHAEAMERVAKKKMKHLQEEERAERIGGPCAGDITREDIEEQQRQDEQMFMEMRMENAQQGTPVEVFDLTGGQSMEELLADAIGEDFSMSDITADVMQELFYSMDETMLDLTDSMGELMDEFSDMMEETLEEVGGLDELAEELLDSVEHTIDPEDLKRKKTKHRTEEQRAIAEADAKYLKAFFEKLQREQQAAAEGAAKIAEAMNGGGEMLSFVGTQTPSAPAARTVHSQGGSGGSIDTAVPEAAAAGVAQAAPAPKAVASGAAPAVGTVVDVSIGE